MKILVGGRLVVGRGAVVEGFGVGFGGRAPGGIVLFRVVAAVVRALAGDGVRLGVGETPATRGTRPIGVSIALPSGSGDDERMRGACLLGDRGGSFCVR